MKKLLNKICLLITGTGLLFLSSCEKRLDDNLYNPNKNINEYLFQYYTGETDFKLDASYKIPDTLITQVVLESKAENEATATKIYGVYIGDINRIKKDTIILYLHGNKEHMDFYFPRAQLLANVGGKNHYGVMMIDYRGYGLSEGEPSEAGLYADAQAAVKWLISKGLRYPRFAVYGFSLGSAPACQLALEWRKYQVDKLILEAPFASAATMVADGAVLNMPPSFFTNQSVNNLNKIKYVQQPFLWIHGIDDDFLDIKTHGETLYNAYDGTYKQAERVPGAGHSTVPQTIGFEKYKELIRHFLIDI